MNSGLYALVNNKVFKQCTQHQELLVSILVVLRCCYTQRAFRQTHTPSTIHTTGQVLCGILGLTVWITLASCALYVSGAENLAFCVCSVALSASRLCSSAPFFFFVASQLTRFIVVHLVSPLLGAGDASGRPAGKIADAVAIGVGAMPCAAGM